MILKPVDTAIVVSVGPLIDDTDFKTVETAIAYNAPGMSVDLFEETATGITKTDLTLTTGGTNDWTHKGSGIYELEITAAQNNTEGILWVEGAATGVLPFGSPRYAVVPVNVFDSIVLGSDKLKVDLDEIKGADAANGVKIKSDGLQLVTIEAGINFEQAVRLVLAALAGKASGFEERKPVFTGAGNSTTRISAQTDDFGNRSSVTLTP